ncbi:MAG: MFS transporter [Clostridia bacterium]|nr:MFS transporter [Clostridia bacterium]
MKLTARHTVRASYVGYLTQAITINFAPLLFITFEETYGISLGKISLLIAVSFLTQLTADAIWAKFSSQFNPRAGAILAHVCAVIGMTGFAWLPEVLPDPYIGLMISVMIAAVGGGIIEVLISPIVEACPTDEKSSAMSLLHSFYSWGLAGVVLLSTLFFATVGIENWRILSCLWAIIPTIGAIAFCFVPIYKLESSTEETAQGAPSLLRSGIFWIFFLMMFCAGAAEQAMAQWASSFAESGLGVSKAVGDILGPCTFAILMGTSRVIYGKSGGKLNLRRFIVLSSILCIVSYLITALSPFPLLSLAGCALCGLSVGILWPGTYSLASSKMPWGGVRMFALLALAGDIGCLVGPTAAGWIAEACGNNLKISFLISVLFPVLILLMCYLGFRKQKKYRP